MNKHAFSRFVLPDYVFHGTIAQYLPSLCDKIINLQYAGKNKDFGSGFYTTIDFYQASKWAKKLSSDLELDEEFVGDITPCVIVIRVDHEVFSNRKIDVLDFRGQSSQWSNFILEHRINSSQDFDPCNIHPQIVCGSMADNNTGDVIETFRKNNMSNELWEHRIWFEEKITFKSTDNIFVSGLELGDQIAFFDESLNEMIKIIGYCYFDIKNKVSNVSRENFWKEWDYYVRYN